MSESTGRLGRPAVVGLALVLLVAGLLRLYHIDFDLPEVQYVDGFKFAGEAARMAKSGDLHPTLFQYPGLYVDTLVALYRALGMASEYGQQLTAALVSAIFGVATVAVTACAARHVSGGLGMFVAAGLAAASPALLTASRTPAPDTLCIFFMILSVALVAGEPTTLRAWAAIGAAAGLAASSKWSGLFVTPILGVAMAAIAWRRRSPSVFLRAMAVASSAALIAFFVTTPYFISLRSAYMNSLAFESHLQRAGQIGRVQLGRFDYLLSSTPTWETPWLGTSLLSDLGPPALLASLGGIGLAAIGRLGFPGVLYAGTAITYLISVSGPGWIKAIRFLLPVLPLLWVLAGAFVEWLLPPTVRRSPLFGVGIVVAMLAAPLSCSLRYAVALGHPSTNALAREWMREHIPAGSVVFVGPFFTEDVTSLPFNFRWFNNVGARQYGLPSGMGLSPERDSIYTQELVDVFKGAGIEYVVLNSYFDGAFTRVAENERFFPRSTANYEAFLARMRKEATVAYVVQGWGDGRIGPDISVWHVGDPGKGTEGPSR